MKIKRTLVSRFFVPFIYLVGGIVACTVGIFLPKRGKRILCAASLYAHIDNVDPMELDSRTLDAYYHELNCLMKLARREDKALLMPLILHRSIWGHISIDELRDIGELPQDEACERLTKMVPWFLRYHPKIMRDDALMILKHRLTQQKMVCKQKELPA